MSLNQKGTRENNATVARLCRRAASLLMAAACIWSIPVIHGAQTVVANLSGSNPLIILDLDTGDRTALVTTNASGLNDINSPVAVARDADGTLIIGENGSMAQLIRVNPFTKQHSVISGPGVGTGDTLINVYGVAVEADGQILVKTGNDTILRVDPSTGNRTIVSGPTVGTGETLYNIFGFILDSNGDIIVPASQSLLRVDPATGNRTVISSSVSTALVGTGPGLSSAYGVIKLPDGDFVVLNGSGSDYLLRVNPATGDRILLSGTARGTGPAISSPYCMSLGEDGMIYVADFVANQIVKVDVDSGDRTIVSSTAVGSGPSFVYPLGILGTSFASITEPFGIADLAGNELAGLPYTSGETYDYQPNAAPTDLVLSPASVNQSSGTDALVGSLSTTDADSADSHTYTLVSGTGDTNNAQFNISGSSLRANDAGALPEGSYSVRVQTDDGKGGTFSKDFTIAVVDDVAPTVTDLNISISGGSGAGPAYRIGDTVTATWNNTGGGDSNSDTIVSVTVDFSQFGGGSAVSATNFSGIWRAAYTIVAGSTSGTNRNISIRAVDNAGNATTTFDSTGAIVDNIAPHVVSIKRKTPSVELVREGPVVFEVTFSEDVAGVRPSYFAVTALNESTVTGAATSVSGGPRIYEVTVGITGGTGKFRLDVAE